MWGLCGVVGIVDLYVTYGLTDDRRAALPLDFLPGWTWKEWAIVFLTVFLVAVLEGAYRQLRAVHVKASYLDGRLDKADEERAERTADRWRAARLEFQKVEVEYRNDADRLLTNLRNLLIREGGRQVSTTWHEYLGSPREVDAAFYEFCVSLWLPLGILGEESRLLAYKTNFRKIHGFFDYVYDLQNEFPGHAPDYLDREVRASQYDVLHVVWYLGHALADVTYQRQKAEQYRNPPRWLLLWNAWNPSGDIPSSPREALFDGEPLVIEGHAELLGGPTTP